MLLCSCVGEHQLDQPGPGGQQHRTCRSKRPRQCSGGKFACFLSVVTFEVGYPPPLPVAHPLLLCICFVLAHRFCKVCVSCVQTGKNTTLHHIYGVTLDQAAETVLERNRVAYVAKAIQECKEESLDLSRKGFGDAEATAIGEQLKVTCLFCMVIRLM